MTIVDNGLESAIIYMNIHKYEKVAIYALCVYAT